jgi:hypothetical protein
MYSGPHFSGWLGTAQRTCAVATGQRHAGAHPDTYTNSKSHADSETDTNPHSKTNADAHSRRRRKLFCAVERLPDLHRGQYRQPQWHQLHGQFLDPEPKPSHQ